VAAAQAVIPGALPLLERTLVGFGGYKTPNPTSVAVRGALALVSGASVEVLSLRLRKSTLASVAGAGTLRGRRSLPGRRLLTLPR
jgi:hypothetical protein